MCYDFLLSYCYVLCLLCGRLESNQSDRENQWHQKKPILSYVSRHPDTAFVLWTMQESNLLGATHYQHFIPFQERYSPFERDLFAILRSPVISVSYIGTLSLQVPFLRPPSCSESTKECYCSIYRYYLASSVFSLQVTAVVWRGLEPLATHVGLVTIHTSRVNLMTSTTDLLSCAVSTCSSLIEELLYFPPLLASNL